MPRGKFFAALVVLSMLATARQPSASGSPAGRPAAVAPAGSYLERAEAGEFDGTTVLIEAQWIDAEARTSPQTST